ncbi:MAG: hypothetical protein M3Z33_03195, partial [Actinomycetota bacterium]|nr:hypothetical protein [Actinomycetota bacterium]
IPPLPAAAAVALVVALLPRLGWTAAAAVGVAWLAVGTPHEPGTAVVVAAGLVACPLLLSRAGAWWSLPALAPALAAVGLACAWPVLAALAPRVYQRAALGALGAWWVALAEPLSGRRLYLGQAAGIAPSVGWTDSARDGAAAALMPLVTSGALATLLIWAAAAAVLPWIVRNRSPGAGAIGVVAWTAALFTGTEILAAALRGTISPLGPRGVLGGAAAAGLAAAGVRLVRTRPRHRSPGLGGAPRVP